VSHLQRPPVVEPLKPLLLPFGLAPGLRFLLA
jgi:hypothetical protein